MREAARRGRRALHGGCHCEERSDVAIRSPVLCGGGPMKASAPTRWVRNKTANTPLWQEGAAPLIGAPFDIVHARGVLVHVQGGRTRPDTCAAIARG